MSANSTRRVVLEGKGPLILRPVDYQTSGGEAFIYRSGKTIIKIYKNLDTAHHNGLAEKIAALQRLSHDSIVAPQGVVMERDKPVGCYMSFAEGEALPLFFTNEFRAQTGFDDTMAAHLVSRQRVTVQYAHDRGAVLVDANEMNWVVDRTVSNPPLPRVFDVDSWAIGRWQASAIMPSIHDWHTKGFTFLSDWFSWAVVTFQVWTGIHPYKGTLDGFDRFDITARMKANKSVFAKGIRLNNAVRDFGCIPNLLRSWYEAVFERGERSIPPSPFDTGLGAPAAARTMRVVTTAANVLIHEKILSVAGKQFVKVFPCGVVLASDGSLYHLATKRMLATLPSQTCEVIRAERGYLAGWIEKHEAKFLYIEDATGEKTFLSLPIAAEKMFRAGDRLFAITENTLTELVLMRFAAPVLSLGQSWGVLGNSSKFFDGVGVMDALGSMFLVMPHGEHACAHIRVPELDGMRVVSGKAGLRFACLIVIDRTGSYKKFSLTLDQEHQTYTIQKDYSDGPDLNMAILPRGVAAAIEDDGELMITVPTGGKVNKVQDKTIATDMVLARWNDRVVYIRNGEVWSVRMQ